MFPAFNQPTYKSEPAKLEIIVTCALKFNYARTDTKLVGAFCLATEPLLSSKCCALRTISPIYPVLEDTLGSSSGFSMTQLRETVRIISPHALVKPLPLWRPQVCALFDVYVGEDRERGWWGTTDLPRLASHFFTLTSTVLENGSFVYRR